VEIPSDSAVTVVCLGTVTATLITRYVPGRTRKMGTRPPLEIEVYRPLTVVANVTLGPRGGAHDAPGGQRGPAEVQLASSAEKTDTVTTTSRAGNLILAARRLTLIPVGRYREQSGCTTGGGPPDGPDLATDQVARCLAHWEPR
jgi:hypothetical protein